MKRVSFGVLFALFFVFIATFPKGIWADEVVQFAWGGYPDVWTTIPLIFRSVGERMNHGQTCVQMILNYLTLRAFGASYFALRFPSFVAYTLSLLAGERALARLGVRAPLRVLFLFGLGFSQINLEQGWEARPYILLQASVMGTLWAWLRYAAGARRGLLVLALVAGVGILFHPFYPAYAGLLVPGFLVVSREQRAFARREIAARWPRLGAVVAGLLLLFAGIAKVSWMHSIHKRFGMDPYEWVGHDRSLARFMLGTFFHPVGRGAVPLLLVLGAWVAWRRREVPRLAAAALVLSVVVAVTQAIITRSVIHSEYWILQRQWVAGNALAWCVAMLLLEAGWRLARVPDRWDRRMFAVATCAGVVFLAVRIGGNLRREFPPIVPLEQSEALLAQRSAQKEITPSQFQDLAHQNLLRHGPVWPVFQRYYGFDSQ